MKGWAADLADLFRLSEAGFTGFFGDFQDNSRKAGSCSLDILSSVDRADGGGPNTWDAPAAKVQTGMGTGYRLT